jgi:long-chain acyl-CoA synthetase
MHTHKTFLAWAFNNVFETGILREDRMLNPYPMFHMGGLIISTTTLFSGASNFMLGKFEPLKLLDVLEKEKLTLFAAIPTIIHAINNLPKEVKDKYPLSATTRFFTSSAPLFTETKDAFTNQWPHMGIYAAYTATEMVYTSLRPPDQARKVRCVGRPAFGTEIKLLDASGKEVPKGQPGLVYGKGISRFIGYYKNPEANRKSFRGEWFTCEDIGYLDDEEYLYLIDRAKDMIISGGENIASAEVENLILKHPAIFECAVIGIPDEQWGEKVRAVVSLKPGQKVTPEEIMEWCKGEIAGYKRPREVKIIPEIPKNSIGKILKRELREGLK